MSINNDVMIKGIFKPYLSDIELEINGPIIAKARVNPSALATRVESNSFISAILSAKAQIAEPVM
jgi:hypothetical protein